LPGSPDEVLISHIDWPDLQYYFRGTPDFEDGVHMETTIDDELTYEMYLDLSRIGCAPWDFNCDGNVDLYDLVLCR